MKKRIFLKSVAVFMLILLVVACGQSSKNSESAAATTKASSIEQKIVGKWNASVGQEGGETKIFDGWIELKDDLTGTSSFSNVKSFTWSYKEIMEGQYYFDVDVNGNHSGILYDESRDYLSLVIPPDTYILFTRNR